MDAHVHLTVPPAADTARLLTRNQRWGVYYRSLVGDIEGRLEFRQIRSDRLRADEVDPTDADAVVAHVERRLQAAGYDTALRAPEGDPVVAGWDIQRRGAG
ncbi:MAG TPA: hypothetical protein VII76_04915 [Acidimicrobiales bacterium]